MNDNMVQDHSSENLDKIYTLIGFMGAGKTTLGKVAARQMGCTFLDLDTIMEFQEGMSIASIFELKGESYFRQLESTVLQDTIRSASPGTIISTGGGAPCFHQNMEFLNQHSVTMFLDVSPTELARRLEPNRAHRPLVSHLSAEKFLEWITNKLSERDQWYRQAQVIITADELSPTELVQWIQYHESGFLR